MFASQGIYIYFFKCKKNPFSWRLWALTTYMLWKSIISATAHKTPMYIRSENKDTYGTFSEHGR